MDAVKKATEELSVEIRKRLASIWRKKTKNQTENKEQGNEGGEDNIKNADFEEGK